MGATPIVTHLDPAAEDTTITAVIAENTIGIVAATAITAGTTETATATAITAITAEAATPDAAPLGHKIDFDHIPATDTPTTVTAPETAAAATPTDTLETQETHPTTAIAQMIEISIPTPEAATPTDITTTHNHPTEDDMVHPTRDQTRPVSHSHEKTLPTPKTTI